MMDIGEIASFVFFYTTPNLMVRSKKMYERACLCEIEKNKNTMCVPFIITSPLLTQGRVAPEVNF